MTHKKEVCRWADCPDGTDVWTRHKTQPGIWLRTSRPSWDASRFYVVDDEWAQLRIAAFDYGDAGIEFIEDGEWKRSDGLSLWKKLAEMLRNGETDDLYPAHRYRVAPVVQIAVDNERNHKEN